MNPNESYLQTTARAQKDTAIFSELSDLDEIIGKWIQKNIDIKQKAGAATHKESEINGLSQSVANQQIQIEELKVRIDNSKASIANGSMSSSQYLELKKQLAEKETELQGLNELLEVHTSALPVIRNEINYHNAIKRSFNTRIAKFIFDKTIDEIVNEVGDKFIALANTMPLIESQAIFENGGAGHANVRIDHMRHAMQQAMFKIVERSTNNGAILSVGDGIIYTENLILNMAKSNDKYGEVTTKDGTIVTIAQPPYFKDRAEGSYYLAAGIDANDNEYIIHWNCVEGWLGMSDKSQHCNWDEYYIKAV